MLEVEHLVIQQILDGTSRSVGAVEDAADDDGVVGGVVVSQHAFGMMGAPGKSGATEQAVKKACVEALEDLVEIVAVSLRGGDTFAAAGLTDVFGLLGDSLRRGMAAIAVRVGGRDGLFVELGEKDVSDGVVDGLWRGLEKVRQANM